MVSVIRHIQLYNMGSVPKWSDKWHSTVAHFWTLFFHPQSQEENYSAAVLHLWSFETQSNIYTELLCR